MVLFENNKVRRRDGEAATARKLAAELWRAAEIADYSGGLRWRYGLFELCSSLRTHKSMEETKKSDIHRSKLDLGSLIEMKLNSRNFKPLRDETEDDKKMAQIREEHTEMCATLGKLKHRVETERRMIKKMDTLNSNLLSDIAKAKQLAQKLTQSFKNEKKARKLSQSTCEKQAKEIESKRRDIEELKIRCGKIRYEVDKQKKMRENLGEERSRMKIVDAELVLEDRYDQMSSLIQELEAYLRSSKKINDPRDRDKVGVLSQPTKESSTHQSNCENFQSLNKKISFNEKTKSSIRDEREVRNPHVVRAMKGRVEWPKGIQRQEKADNNALKLKLESEKMLLRSVLKHKT